MEGNLKKLNNNEEIKSGPNPKYSTFKVRSNTIVPSV
jgi:hypothetical protein